MRLGLVRNTRLGLVRNTRLGLVRKRYNVRFREFCEPIRELIANLHVQ